MSGGNKRLVVSSIKYPEFVGKRFWIQDGELKSETRGAHSMLGERVDFIGVPAEFLEWRKSLGGNSILLPGTFDPDDPSTEVVTKAQTRSGQLARSLDCLDFRDGPGIVIVDIDVKREEDVVALFAERTVSTPEEAVEALEMIGVGEAHMIAGYSSGGNILDAEGNLSREASGIRVYLFAEDAKETPEILKRLYKLGWNHGFGWGFVDKAGGIQERSLVDMAMARANQPDFVTPELGDGLSQDRGWVERRGKFVKLADLPSGGDADKGEMRAALEPRAKRQRERQIEQEQKRLIAAGVSPESAKLQAHALIEGQELGPDIKIEFENGDVVSVRDLKNNGGKYDKAICRDPIEPTYDGGRAVAQFYWNNGIGQRIHSFAHGSRTYELTLERADNDNLSPPDSLAVPLAFPSEESIPKRRFILGTDYLRGACSLTIAPGGVGKSTLVLQEAIAIATGRDQVCGMNVLEQCPVWYINAEEPTDEINRRAAGVIKHFDVDKADVTGKVFFSSGIDAHQFIVARETKEGLVKTADVEKITAEIDRLDIGVLIVDPLVRAHAVNENANDAIDFVVQQFAKIAATTNCAVMLVHHTRKPQGGSAEGHAGNADSGRGASSLIGGVRAARTLYTITKKHAEKIGVPVKEKHRFTRLDSAKANYSEPMPEDKPHGWYRREGVSLMNGDYVGVLVPHDFNKELLDAGEKARQNQRELLRDLRNVLPEDGGWISVNKAASLLATKHSDYSDFLEISGKEAGKRANRTLRSNIVEACAFEGSDLETYARSWEGDDGQCVTVAIDSEKKNVRRWVRDG